MQEGRRSSAFFASKDSFAGTESAAGLRLHLFAPEQAAKKAGLAKASPEICGWSIKDVSPRNAKD